MGDNPNSKRPKVDVDPINLRIKEFFRKMEEEKLMRRNCPYWSQLPPDLIHSVLERLSFRDFKRAKSVCSSWFSASSNCMPRNQIPWLIIFPPHEYNNNINRCKLINPEEKDNIYTSRDMGVGFAESVCVATYGFWLLMRTSLFHFYIVNLLTGERIHGLPRVESQVGKTKLQRIVDDKFRATMTQSSIGYQYIVKADSIGLEINSPRLWIDDETKEYMVMLCFRIFKWSHGTQYAIICKKGDHCWRQIPDCFPCGDLVYKNQKLYVYNCCSGDIKISDFSGDLPRKAPETDLYVKPFFLDWFGLIPASGPIIVKKTNIVVTVSGDVLMVASQMDSCKNWEFCIYKMSSRWDKWERVLHLGDEAMLLDFGITVPAKEIQGIKRNSIYFSGGLGEDENDIIIFDISTNKIKRPYQSSICSSLLYSPARWFFPSFSRKYS